MSAARAAGARLSKNGKPIDAQPFALEIAASIEKRKTDRRDPFVQVVIREPSSSRSVVRDPSSWIGVYVIPSACMSFQLGDRIAGIEVEGSSSVIREPRSGRLRAWVEGRGPGSKKRRG